LGLACRVVVPEGKVALGKLAQAIVHGARIIVVRGNFDVALTVTRAAAGKGGIALLNSVNPHRLEGQKTAAFEIVEAFGGAPDGLALPVGNAGNISAYWRGFVELGARLPLYGIQAKGAAPFLSGGPVENPETFATAIRIGNPASWALALRARQESGGEFAAVSDDEIVAAGARLAGEAGVFCEPASAAPVAGLLRLARERPGRFAGQRLVAVLTGHGLKDAQAAIAQAKPLPEPIAPESVGEALR
jgi:threonine synthase